MAGEPGAADRFDVMASHPRTTERIENMARGAAAAHAGASKINRDGYLAAIDGMVFGDSPAQGFRRGNEFRHPGLGIAFTVPPGFTMTNTPSQLVARTKDGAAIVFDSERAAVARSSGGSMTAYLTQVWGRQVQLSGVEAINVNGLPAATGVTRQKTRSGAIIDLRLVAIRAAPEQIYRFLLVTPANLTSRLGPEMLRTVASFRKLTPEQAAAVKPLRINVVTVKPGDTAAGLAARMPFGAYNGRWFALINGFDRGEALKTGEPVKLIVQ